MKIIDIFATRNLFSVHYENEKYNEYRRLMEYWEDPEKVRQFLKANSNDIPSHKTIISISEEIIEESYEINDSILEIIEHEPVNLDLFFAPLNNAEFQEMILSKRKGKLKTKHLRLYAIKIEKNTYIITGGAIKLPLQHLMEDREHTKIELQKLNSVRDFLKEKGIFDNDSFFEFLNEKTS